MASKERTHEVYTAFLSLLTLSEEHREGLSARGFSDEAIELREYKSLDSKRNTLLPKLLQKVGDPKEVPGFYTNVNGLWKCTGANGILIPVRDADGLIESIKIRLDAPKSPQQKYVVLSSPRGDNGMKGKIALHCPLGRESGDEITTLRITEGELKADLCTEFLDGYTISIPGVTSYKYCIPFIENILHSGGKIGSILVSFDSDKEKEHHNEYADMANDGKFIVGEAAASLFLSFQKKFPSITTSIEHWEENSGKGLDDVIALGNEDAVSILSPEESKEFCEKVLGDKVKENLKWVYVIERKKFVCLETAREYDKEQFGDLFNEDDSMINRSFSESVIKNPTFAKVDTSEYWPEAGQIIERENGVRSVNTWVRRELKEQEMDIQFVHDHFKNLIPDDFVRDHIIKYLAHNYQFPGVKIFHCPLIQSVQGTGKSFIIVMMQHALGKQNVSIPSNREIQKDYNGYQKGCCFIGLEELMVNGRLEFANELKPLITQDTTRIREMRVAPYDYPNRFNFFALTNHKNATILEAGDRRWMPYFSPMKPQPPEYYVNLFDNMKVSIEGIRYWLRKIDLSAFNPFAPAPMTEAKAYMVDSSLYEYELWIKESIQDETFPFSVDLVHPKHIAEHVPKWIKSRPTPRQITLALSTHGGAVNQGRIRNDIGEKITLYSLRRHEAYEGLDSKTLKDLYYKDLPNNMPGGNPADFQATM